ncbi:Two-component response regulator SSK1p [Teratosphaeriaceae sp. CCFEE 6253]|nr:Two-component response regulator SSK1p [Teratosphaeriaceae sp. CCFEE 6253]
MPRFSLRPRFLQRNAVRSTDTLPIDTPTASDRRTSSPPPPLTANTDGAASESLPRDPSPTTLALPPTPRRKSPTLPQERRRSSSRSRLREKFLERGAEVPECVLEVRESVLLRDDAAEARDLEAGSETAGSGSRRSGSDTLASLRPSPAGEKWSGSGSGSGGSAVGQERQTGQERDGSVTELRLDLDDLEQAPSNTPPSVVVEGPTPSGEEALAGVEAENTRDPAPAERIALTDFGHTSNDTIVSSANVSPNTRPADAQQTPVPLATLDRKLIPPRIDSYNPGPYFLTSPSFSTTPTDSSAMAHAVMPPPPRQRKVWVRRPGASATLIPYHPNDMVDDVREVILRKYKNSLGGTFDAPDMTLRLFQRVNGAALSQQQESLERILSPDEDMARVIDAHYPGGQTVAEALVIDVPARERERPRTTPRPSPRAPIHYPQGPAAGSAAAYYHALDDYRPREEGGDYFPLMPAAAPGSVSGVVHGPTGAYQQHTHDPRAALAHAHHPSNAGLPTMQDLPHPPRSIAVLHTGQLPLLPSPGGTLRDRGQRVNVVPGHRDRDHGRPRFARQQTSSPILAPHAAAHNLNPGAAVGGSGGGGGGGANGQPAMNPQHALVQRGSQRPREGSQAAAVPDPHALHPSQAAAGPQPPTPPATGGEMDSLPAPLPVGGSNGSAPPTPSSASGSGILPPGSRAGKGRKIRKVTPDKAVSGSRTRHARGESGAHAARGANGTGPTASGGGGAGTGTTGTGTGTPSVSSVLDGSVPPINVLIVEDNIINLRILEGLMKRLRVRWQTAMNGQIAVDKWRGGGYHLVLMDIQMPVMNGLQATKEIRRLERANGIGVFSSAELEGEDVGKIRKLGSVEEIIDDADADAAAAAGKPKGGSPGANPDDRLSLNEGSFKSPIIIVALTASSLQSDRHEALAAGCNDFLTKPVNFVWLERKVKEWGCMQALIDFDGWRRWKEVAALEEEGKSDEQREAERVKAEKEKRRMEKMALLQEKQRVKKEEEERKKRGSMQVSDFLPGTNGGEA